MILLIQFRTNQSGWHEIKCFYSCLDLPYNQILIINAGSDEVSVDDLLGFANKSKKIIIGGLGEASYGEKNLKKKKWFDAVRKKTIFVLKKIIKKNKTPVLGVCFGHQLLAEALGSVVSYAPNQAESGVTKIFLTREGQKDLLFYGFKKSFLSIEGHKDAVITLPKKAVLLAYSNRCKIQAFRFGKKIYGVQFHPELGYDDFLYRLSLYPNYKKPKNKKDESKIKIKTQKIIKNFLRWT